MAVLHTITLQYYITIVLVVLEWYCQFLHHDTRDSQTTLHYYISTVMIHKSPMNPQEIVLLLYCYYMCIDVYRISTCLSIVFLWIPCIYALPYISTIHYYVSLKYPWNSISTIFLQQPSSIPHRYPPVICCIAIEAMSIEIVSFPMNGKVEFSRVMVVYQRVIIPKSVSTINPCYLPHNIPLMVV